MMATDNTNHVEIPCVLNSTRIVSIHEEPVESQQSETPDNRQASIAPAACVACRTKHLKCDGRFPCSRCAVHKIGCSYVKSRRGYKGPRKNQKKALKDSTCSDYPGSENSSLHSSYDGFSRSNLPSLSSRQMALGSHSTSESQPNGQLSSSSGAVCDRYMEAFFYYVHPAHPFLLPKVRLLSTLSQISIPHLEAAIKYLGSFHIPNAPSSLLARDTLHYLSRPDLPKNGYTVQALLLTVIGLDSAFQREKALELLEQAETIAIDIGLNHLEFARLNGGGDDVLEESWRRTWWELYIVDGMIAGIHQKSTFKMNEVASDVLLPCEEIEYSTGIIPPSHSISELTDDSFEAEDVVFSSFAYRICAIQNLGRILKHQNVIFSDDPVIHQTDAHIVNWTLGLPGTKKLSINQNGEVDEMLFQAIMITNASSIMLHRQHSVLDTTVARTVTACTPHKDIPRGQSYNIHAAKCIEAAENISKLITLPVPQSSHTPFFACVVTSASIIHLSCWAALLPFSEDDVLKQNIRLNANALKAISEVWPSAAVTLAQVRAVGKEIYSARKLAVEEGWWGTFTDEELMRSITEDEGVVSTLQST